MDQHRDRYANLQCSAPRRERVLRPAKPNSLPQKRARAEITALNTASREEKTDTCRNRRQMVPD